MVTYGYNNKKRCYICDGEKYILICSNPLKDNLITNHNKTIKTFKDKKQPESIKIRCPHCDGYGIIEVHPNNGFFKRT